MPLTWSPRTSFDVTVDLNTTTARTFSQYGGQHVRVIPKPVVDTGIGLLFQNAASVTIIGGEFQPSARAQFSASSVADGSFVFFSVGEVYIEGTILNNVNVGNLDGIQIALSANTTVTLQNMRIENVQGIESGLHGDLFQAGSNNQGKLGPLRVDHFTGTCNYQGFFIDPQDAGTRGGGLTNTDLRNVNLRRTVQVTSPGIPRLFFFYNSADRYASDGYPISLTNCWADVGPGQTIENDGVWPADTAGSQNQWPTAGQRAQRGTDDTGAFAHWPGLNTAGKVLSGKVYEGVPAVGDFVPRDRIGIGYVAGTDLDTTTTPTVVYRSTLPARFAATTTRTFLDLRRTLAGTSVLDTITLAPVEHGTWTDEGTGTMTVNSPTSIDLVATGTGSKSARVSYATQAGLNYALTFTMGGQSATVSVGSNPDAVNLNAGVTAPIGVNTVSFTALSSISHVKFSTTVSGSMFLSGLSIAQSIWATGGPGTVTNQTATTVTLNGVGGTPTYARRVIATTPGETYTVTWTSDSAIGTWAIGSTLEGDELAAPGPSFVAGANSARFVAISDFTYFRFQRTAAGTVNITAVASGATPVLSWTGGGAGTTVIPSDSQVTLNSVGTAATYARRTFATAPDRKYRFDHTWANNAGTITLGTTAGGGELLPSANTVVGPNSLEFVSDSTPTHVEISRTPAGAATVTGLTVTELSTHAWYSGGPGAVTVGGNTNLSLTGTGTGTTYVIRPIATIKDREYIWTFSVAGGTPTRMVGSGFGGSDLAASAAATAGANTVRFAAISHQSWPRIQQAAASSAISISNIGFALLPFEASSTWTISGTGTTSIDANQTVTINGNGTTATAARRSYNTIPGKSYELLVNVTGNQMAYQVGTTDGGTQIIAQTLVNPGTISIKFTATTATTYLHVQRVTAGVTVITRPVMSVVTVTNTVSATINSFNADNLGGIGKPYWYVDRLSDSATDGTGNRGSLRYCLNNSVGSDRLILSEIQGVCIPTSGIGIPPGRNNVTLAFYTGPGPFVIQGTFGTFTIRGQNNVIEHLTVERKYSDAGAVNGDGMQIISTGAVNHHILVRNCFTSYSQDEAFQIFRSRNQAAVDRVDDVSLHWNIFTNPLKDPREFNPNFLSNTNVDDFANGQDGDHNFNVLIGGYSTRIDLQRNFMGNAKQRNPRMCAPLTNTLIANNVSFNYGYGGIGFQSDTDDWQQTNNPPGSLRYAVSIIGNIGIPGPNSSRVELISQHGPGRLGGDSIIHIANNSIIQGLNAAVVGTANTIGYENASRAHYPEFPGINPNRQDTLTNVLAIAQAQLMAEMNLNVGPFPKLRAANPNLLIGATHAVRQMNNEVAGKWINHESEGPGFSNPPTVTRPLTGNLAPPADHTNVAQVQAWLRERRLEVAYD